jgi:hypothetical protein
MRNHISHFDNFFGSNSRKHATHHGLYCVWTREGDILVRRWIDPEAEANHQDEMEMSPVDAEAGKRRLGIHLRAA